MESENPISRVVAELCDGARIAQWHHGTPGSSNNNDGFVCEVARGGRVVLARAFGGDCISRCIIDRDEASRLRQSHTSYVMASRVDT